MKLIVGASGFIGNKIFTSFKNSNTQVRGTYTSNSNNIYPEDMLHLDLERRETFPEHEVFDYVILAHGISRIETCEIEKERTYFVNVTQTIGLLESLKRINKNIIPAYLSSNMVYGCSNKVPVETDATIPEFEYGKQKLEVEQYIAKSFEEYIILRPSKVYGVEKNDHTLFTTWLDKLLNNEKIAVVDGYALSPVFVGDLVSALHVLLNDNKRGIFNIGGERAISIYNLAEDFAAFFGRKPDVLRKVDLRDTVFNGHAFINNSVNSEKIARLLRRRFMSYGESFELIKRNYSL